VIYAVLKASRTLFVAVCLDGFEITLCNENGLSSGFDCSWGGAHYHATQHSETL